ncbi:MAG: alanine--tRNA ligase [Candidatus Shapirobacteria bacterium]|nr:alanine--tRNA ligase [Candidatus Shapirobacteria bacterium]
MKSREIEKKFIQFFVSRKHLLIPQISLVPENDPTLLFTSAGMVALKSYFLGLEKPPHNRLVNVQRCLRTTDINKVGQNARTLSFFEMLGSWSIGDYFKEGAIKLAWQFLTTHLNFSPENLWVSYFAGDSDYPQVPADKESAKIWQEIGLDSDHIVGLGYQDNFWQSGEIGPCGPSTEVYFDRGESFGCKEKTCRPGCDCDRFLEIWNAGVFMQYNRTSQDQYQPLPFNSVDTGAGLERLAMVLQKKNSVFETDLFIPLTNQINKLASIGSGQEADKQQLINRIADHIRASVFLIADGVVPSNQEQGYILRRLIRRAVDAADRIGLSDLSQLVSVVVVNYQSAYSYLAGQEDKIKQILLTEEGGFRKAIRRGKKKIILMSEEKKTQGKPLSGQEVFYFTQTFGLPPELVKKEFSKQAIVLNKNIDQELLQAQKEHQQKSRSDQKFKGGLADNSDRVVAYHTATHLLHQALRTTLGDHVHQTGSNITSHRLRFDFIHPKALTKEEISKIEKIINEQIKANLPVTYREKTIEEAKKDGALAFFEDRYRQGKIRVYKIGDFSVEVCGGPHLKRTGLMGKFIISKEKSIGSGKRRIYGILEEDQ